MAQAASHARRGRPWARHGAAFQGSRRVQGRRAPVSSPCQARRARRAPSARGPSGVSDPHGGLRPAARGRCWPAAAATGRICAQREGRAQAVAKCMQRVHACIASISASRLLGPWLALHHVESNRATLQPADYAVSHGEAPSRRLHQHDSQTCSSFSYASEHGQEVQESDLVCSEAPDGATSGCRRDGLVCLQYPQAAHGGCRLAARLQRCLLLPALHEPGVCIACRFRTCRQGASL